MSTGLVVQDKVRSLCLGVELCVVCGDRASGVYTRQHKLVSRTRVVKCGDFAFYAFPLESGVMSPSM